MLKITQVSIRSSIRKHRSSLRYDIDHIDFPKFFARLNLRALDECYDLVFDHLRDLWSDQIDLIADLDMNHRPHTTVFEGSVKSYPHMHFKALRYGAGRTHRGKSARYAYIRARIPVEIQYIFRIEQAMAIGPPLIANLALVRPFLRGNDLPQFPWDLWCVETF